MLMKRSVIIFQVNTSILELDLEDNWMEAEGAKDLAEMLMENCYIATLVD